MSALSDYARQPSSGNWLKRHFGFAGIEGLDWI
jgi:hypothetical protein